MKIKRATKRDIQHLLSLALEFTEDHDNIVLDKNKNLAEIIQKKDNIDHIIETYMSDCLHKRNDLILLAEIDKKPIGYIHAVIRNEIAIYKIKKLGHIAELFVKREFRKSGIAGKLLNETLKWFKIKNAGYAMINVYSENGKAHNIYKNWGFFDCRMEMRKRI